MELIKPKKLLYSNKTETYDSNFDITRQLPFKTEFVLRSQPNVPVLVTHTETKNFQIKKIQKCGDEFKIVIWSDSIENKQPSIDTLGLQLTTSSKNITFNLNFFASGMDFS